MAHYEPINTRVLAETALRRVTNVDCRPAAGETLVMMASPFQLIHFLNARRSARHFMINYAAAAGERRKNAESTDNRNSGNSNKGDRDDNGPAADQKNPRKTKGDGKDGNEIEV